MDNFDFLKHKNKELFKIIVEAEQLFRDEYFDQSVIQVRKFAENLCRDILAQNAEADDTFDLMINKIKDNSFENIRMQEFVDDLYFIKKNGNSSAHSSDEVIGGEVALECLERAFEISVFYSHIKFGYDEDLDKTLFSEEILITGKTEKKTSLKAKYVKELENERNEQKERVIKSISSKNISPNKKKGKTSKKTKKEVPDSYEIKTQQSNFVKIIFITLIVLTVTTVVLYILK